jgi:hypothetical protein
VRLFVKLIGGAFFFGSVAIFFAVLNAPEGFEDEWGFHAGRQYDNDDFELLSDDSVP